MAKKKTATVTNINEKELEIMYIPTGNPYINQWHIWEKTDKGCTNLVKVLQPVSEQLVNGQQGPIKQKVLGQYEFYVVEFFADGLVFDIEAGFYVRSLKSDEELYSGYMSVINARKKQQIELEARKKMQDVEKGQTTEMSQ